MRDTISSTLNTVIDKERLPRHVAIIMDGNGRWAKNQNRPRLFGHRAGVESVREIVETCREIGVKYLTLYAFSSENWRRPEEEVYGLMGLLQNYLNSELRKMLQNGVRLLSIGDHSRLPKNVQKTLYTVIEETAQNSSLTLTLALSYGGREEIVRAVKRQLEQCQAGKVDSSEISEDSFGQCLDTCDLPDPDLLIRTGGEARLSNFLLWQLSYAEIFFTDTMWPEFRRNMFLNVLLEYQNRERRFGRIGDQLKQDAS